MKFTSAAILAVLVIGATPQFSNAEQPDCSGVDRWATTMAFVHLKNAGLTDNTKLDFSRTRVVLLASEKIANDLYRQVHFIAFTEKTGQTIEVITENDASSEECSMSGVEVFVVSRHLGGK